MARKTDPRVLRRRRLLSMAAVLVCMGLIAVVLHGPLARMLRSKHQLADMEWKLNQEKQTTRALKERKNLALSEEYVEWEARKMGYVKPGEIPLIVVEEESGEEPGEGASSPVSFP